MTNTHFSQLFLPLAVSALALALMFLPAMVKATERPDSLAGQDQLKERGKCPYASRINHPATGYHGDLMLLVRTHQWMLDHTRTKSRERTPTLREVSIPVTEPGAYLTDQRSGLHQHVVSF